MSGMCVVAFNLSTSRNKKKLSSTTPNYGTRSNARGNRLGRDDSPSKDPPDKGSSKPISPRQIHPVDHVPPTPYARQSLEKSRTAPTKILPGTNPYSKFQDSKATQGFCHQRHTMQGPAYPTAPNICVTGGKIEFIKSKAGSPVSSEASGVSSAGVSPCLSPQRVVRHPPTSCSSDHGQYKKSATSPTVPPKYATSRTPFSFYSSSEFTPSPTPSTSSRRSLRRKERMERRKADLNNQKSYSLNQRRASSQNNSTTVCSSKSSTMPCQSDAEQEIAKLREENKTVKLQLSTIQREFSKALLKGSKDGDDTPNEKQLEKKVHNLQIVNKEAESLVGENEEFKNKLKDYQEVLNRCNALEYANAQLQTEAQAQRQQYEKCLDKVASQVVQAIIVQKSQQEQCDRLTKEVGDLQKQNANLCSLLGEKANSLSPSHMQSRVPSFFLSHNIDHYSHSLPSTLRNQKNLYHKTKRKDLSLCSEYECQTENGFLRNESPVASQSPFSEDSLETTKAVRTQSKEEGCWYDIIKSLRVGDPSQDQKHSGIPKGTDSTSNSGDSEEYSHFILPTECPVVSSTKASQNVTFSARNSVAHPLVYSQSSNNQELIVNYSLMPQVSTASITPIVPACKKVQTTSSEVITKDEGYSTMSSDVQTKDVIPSVIPTLFEEKGKIVETAEPEDSSQDTLVVHKSEKPEFVDGLRVVYDDENDSDVFVLALNEKHHRYSCNLPPKFNRVTRSLSDSCINKPSQKEIFQKTMPYFSSMKKQNQVTLKLNPVNSPLKKRINRKRSDQDSSDTKPSKNGSPSYSHAEMEDWSLDLSGEDLTQGDLDPSFETPDMSAEQPDIDLEEDTNEFLWNGASYFKSDFDWYEKRKSWDVKLRQRNGRNIHSPKSGCSDQPAIWSSSEQLSCCSDIASKCSTDIENFCEQLCNLPELKRISVSSIDNIPEANMTKVNELEPLGDDDTAVDTVFTRDFYRLVKFESTKSLAASSKSLAMSDHAFLDKLKEAPTDNKTLASVLGFIAEQQKYCRQREELDETSLTLPTNLRSGASLCAKNNVLNNLNTVGNTSLRNNNILRDDSERLRSNRAYLSNNDVDNSPNRPIRSTSLNFGYKRFDQVAKQEKPMPPSRSSSRVTLPRHSFPSGPNGQDFPPPLNSVTEATVSSDSEKGSPPIPPHNVPPIPERFTSLRVFTCDSPPVPKRVTSRALPIPPNPVHTPPRTTSKRPKSLLKEDCVRSTQKDRNSCGELSPMCRSSAALLLQLKKMVQDEEETKDMYVSPVDTKCEESALGTGWVRVQPPSDLQNPELRANLLDAMMPSSEAASTETEEDMVNKSQHVELLKAAQRNRRKKKVSRHNVDSMARSVQPVSDDASSDFLDRPLKPRLSTLGSKDLNELRSSEPYIENHYATPIDSYRTPPSGTVTGKISLFQCKTSDEPKKPNIPTTSIVGKIRQNFERQTQENKERKSIQPQTVNVRATIEKFDKPIYQTNVDKCPKKSKFYNLRSSKNVFFGRKSMNKNKTKSGKLSFSDSCAETFSPFGSDDDVFKA